MKVAGYLRVRTGIVRSFDIGGRFLGAAGAWIMAGWDGFNAYKEFKRGNGWLSFLYGVSSVINFGLGVAIIMLSLSFIAYLFIFGFIVSLLISIFQIEDTQNWLNHSFYGQSARFENVKLSNKELFNLMG